MKTQIVTPKGQGHAAGSLPLFFGAFLWPGMLVCHAAEVANELQTSSAPAAAVERWKDWRFGLFVHFDTASLKGTEISWSRAGERRDRQEIVSEGIPAAEYDNLYHRFNPSNFNGPEWAATAKAAGANYLVFTAKHHDGFAM